MINISIKDLQRNTLIRYLFVGGTAFIVEMILLFGLSEGLHLSAVLSVGISFWVGLIISFILQKFLAFNNKTTKTKHLLKQSLQYSALVFVNYLFTLAFVGIFEPLIGLFIARTIALIITTFWNYFIYKHVLFVNKNHDAI